MKKKTSELTLDEIFSQYAKQQYRTWIQPKSGDLLGDARYFLTRAKVTSNKSYRARYARACLVASVAAIEAITNDALATIYRLLVDCWPIECRGDSPRVYFENTSYRPVLRLLKKGKFGNKIQYVFRHIERLTHTNIDDDLRARLKGVIQARNRIVHMTYLMNPKRYPSIMNDRQVIYSAEIGLETAREYISLVDESFSEINLPIETIRPEWYFDEETVESTNER